MNKEAQEEREAQALQNALDHFGLKIALVRHYFSDNRKKTKFYLQGAEHNSSPVFDYNQMNIYILGLGFHKEYFK